MIHSSWSLVSHPPTPSQLPSYIMLRFPSQFDSHNGIYRRSRTTCDSSCSFLGRERHTQAAALDFNDDALHTHAVERPRGRAVLFPILPLTHIGIQRDQSKAYLPLSTSKCHTRWGVCAEVLVWRISLPCKFAVPSLHSLENSDSITAFSLAVYSPPPSVRNWWTR